MHIFKMIRGPFYNQDGADGGDNGGGDGGQQQPGKTFTQAEVDEMMSKRWKDAEMSKAELKEFTDLIKEFGYEGSTPTEVRAKVKADLDQRKKAAEIKALEKEADELGADPELLKELREMKKELADMKKDKEEKEKEQRTKEAAQKAFEKSVADLQEKHPELDTAKLFENEKFVKFARRSNPSLSLIEVYEDYMDMASEAERDAIEKIKANSGRSTSSGRGKADPDGGTYGLTAHQQKLAKENNMTNKQYAELLGQITKR